MKVKEKISGDLVTAAVHARRSTNTFSLRHYMISAWLI